MTANFSIREMAKKARSASLELAKLSTAKKNAVLEKIANNIEQQAISILDGNEKDIKASKKAGLADSMIDRLTLDLQRISNMANAVRDIAKQPDPIGKLSNTETRPSGIRVGKMRIPLGVIAMIYESRPNVTIDAAALCFKAGNAVVLRGGKEALNSNLALAECIYQALESENVTSDAVVVVPNPDREVMNELMTLNEHIDLIIPRGGEGLIRFVSENSRIPVIQHYKGVCHLYVDKAADEVKALALLENGKTQRVGVCNSLETLLVHKDRLETFMPKVAAMFNEHGVVVHACEQSLGYFESGSAATEDDWHAEYLAMEIAVRVVDDFDAAIEHIERFSSGHTEVIATEDEQVAQQFIQTINSAVVMANASSRFSDGGELGLGAEIGISTSKLHAYGPMGVESLTTEKFVVLGEGHIRE